MSIVTSDKVERRRGAAVLLEVLRSEGARYIFGNPGTTELPLIDALVDAPRAGAGLVDREGELRNYAQVQALDQGLAQERLGVRQRGQDPR